MVKLTLTILWRDGGRDGGREEERKEKEEKKGEEKKRWTRGRRKGGMNRGCVKKHSASIHQLHCHSCT